MTPYRRTPYWSLFGPLGAVLGAPLPAVGDASRVQAAADDVVTNTGKVLHAPTANQNHRVLLQVVPLARDVGRHFHSVGEPNTGDLTKGRVRLLGGRGVHAHANATPLRAAL